jgi:hypothetical protein
MTEEHEIIKMNPLEFKSLVAKEDDPNVLAEYSEVLVDRIDRLWHDMHEKYRRDRFEVHDSIVVKIRYLNERFQNL